MIGLEDRHILQADGNIEFRITWNSVRSIFFIRQSCTGKILVKEIDVVRRGPHYKDVIDEQ